MSDYANDPGLTKKEVPLAEAGLCVWQTGYGLPWITYCKEPRPEPNKYYCAEHARDAREEYGWKGVV